LKGLVEHRDAWRYSVFVPMVNDESRRASRSFRKSTVINGKDSRYL
jgi:hypothetical protein